MQVKAIRTFIFAQAERNPTQGIYNMTFITLTVTGLSITLRVKLVVTITKISCRLGCSPFNSISLAVLH
jgi:hypothetical protein